MTISDFDRSMEVDVVKDNDHHHSGLERENMLASETTVKYLQFVTDHKFLRGVFYTTIPVTICSIILILAYRRDLMSARTPSTSTVFKIPVFLIAVFALSAPFIIKYGDDAFLKLFPDYNFLGIKPSFVPIRPSQKPLAQPVQPAVGNNAGGGGVGVGGGGAVAAAGAAAGPQPGGAAGVVEEPEQDLGDVANVKANPED